LIFILDTGNYKYLHRWLMHQMFSRSDVYIQTAFIHLEGAV
jgi:hypothetical protein